MTDRELETEVIDDLVHQLLPVILATRLRLNQDGEAEAITMPLQAAVDQARLARRVLGRSHGSTPTQDALSAALSRLEHHAAGTSIVASASIAPEVDALALSVRALLGRTVSALTDVWVTWGGGPSSVHLDLFVDAGSVTLDVTATSVCLARPLGSEVVQRWRFYGGWLAQQPCHHGIHGTSVSAWLPR